MRMELMKLGMIRFKKVNLGLGSFHYHDLYTTNTDAGALFTFTCPLKFMTWSPSLAF